MNTFDTSAAVVHMIQDLLVSMVFLKVGGATHWGAATWRQWGPKVGGKMKKKIKYLHPCQLKICNQFQYVQKTNTTLAMSKTELHPYLMFRFYCLICMINTKKLHKIGDCGGKFYLVT